MTAPLPPWRAARGAEPRGFSLVELLVAISIIAILLALIAAVGLGAFSNQRAAQAQGVLNTLDRALEEYRLVQEDFPRFNPYDYVQRPGPAWSAASDGTPDAGNASLAGAAFGADPRAPLSSRFPKKPSAAVFLRQSRGIAESESILAGLPSDIFISTPRGVVATPTGDQPAETDALTILDPWAVPAPEWTRFKSGSTPVYPALQQSYYVYVHPDNLLAQSLYGACVNGRPYFVSAGPDRTMGLSAEFPDEVFNLDAASKRVAVEGALKDNIYSYPVGRPDLSDNFWNNRR